MEIHKTKLEVDIVPTEVDAGTSFVVTARAACSAGCDLRDRVIEIIGSDGVVATGTLGPIQSDWNQTENIVVVVPKEVGEYAWTVVLPIHETESPVHEEASAQIAVTGTAHRTSIAVWDVPSPIARDNAFTIKAGVRCRAMCALTQGGVEVRDDSGAIVGQGRLGDSPWIGTAALYWTELELTAPSTEGLAHYTATFTKAELDIPHETCSIAFSFKSDKPPEHRVIVRVIAQATQDPVPDVEVRMGLYAGWTNATGVAELALPSGSYELSIRKEAFQADPMALEVIADVALDVIALPGPTREELEEKIMRVEDYPWS